MTENLIPTNNAAGPYNDAQAKHVRPEHNARRFNGPYIEYYGPVEDIKPGWVLPEVRDSRLHAVIFLCPCGCGKLNAFPTQGSLLEASWTANFGTEGRLTMSPSINMTEGCKSHYTIRNGMVEWC